MKLSTILVATDLQPSSRPALAAALDLARRTGARVTALFVLASPAETSSWHGPIF
jgi:nucleotide-binding universal stress UspA family protein